MRPSFNPYEIQREAFENSKEDPGESKHIEENIGKNTEEINEENEILKAAKEELEVENIMKGITIQETQVDPKLGKALNKFIQLYAPNHIDSTLKTKL